MPNTYTVGEILSVIARNKGNGADLHASSRHFSVDRKIIKDWLSKENELLRNNYVNLLINESSDYAGCHFLKNWTIYCSNSLKWSAQ